MKTSPVGSWRLLSAKVEMMETGETSDFFGAKPRGRAILTEDGYMMGLLTSANRSPASDQAGMAALFGSLMAYSGPYRIEKDKLITRCDLAWQPAWVGTEQVRLISFSGDQMTLTSPSQTHPSFPGREVRGVLAWRREP